MTDFDPLDYHRKRIAVEERAEELREQILEAQRELTGYPDYRGPSPRQLLDLIFKLDDRVKALEDKND